MSQRGKRGNRFDNENNAHQQTQQPPSKRRKGRPPTSSNGDADQEMSTGTTTIPVVSAGVQPNLSSAAPSSSSTMWQARPITGPQIYNRNSSEAPAELFRKDLISAMKLPDSEPLSTDEYWIIVDQWKQEWERGVQVPVNPDSLPEPSVKELQTPIALTRHDFKPPKNKYLRITKDENFSSEQHFLSNAPALAESACSYDLDQVDEVWLKIVNNERTACGAPSVSEAQFERVIEELEVRCWERIQAIMRNEEGLGIEYDENVICDVCRSPDSEEANEMVFCDNCNICVHQACYGITVIPSGQWLCRTCSMGKKPDCALCPNKGGAMKSTRSGKKWAHVSCALWIPEVSIGCVDKMEPITKISSIPQTRWSLLCILCRERVGACIQCSVSTCKTAYHVTCAFQHGLEMRAIIEEGNAEDGVKLRSYCLKHCNAKGKKEKGTNNNGSGSDDDCRRRKIRSDMTSEERNQARLMRSKEVEAEFDKHVNIKDISCHLLDVDQEAITSIYNYWILKRKSANNRPLIPPKVDDADMVPNRQDQADIEKKIMFVHLRQDLERVRNLCYMVNRREKLSRTFFKMREQIFHKQTAILSENLSRNYDERVISAIIHANNGSSVYDKSYSSSSLGSPVINVEELQERILGAQQLFDSTASSVGTHSTAVVDKNNKKSFNSSSKRKKIHLNGISDRKAAADNIFEDSSFSSNSEGPDNYRFRADSSSLQGKKKAQTYSNISEKHKRRKSMASSIGADSSTDEEEMQRERSGPKKNPSLHQMEKELAKDSEQLLSSSDDSDLLMPIRQTSNQLTNKKSQQPIYSDSDSTDKEKTDNTISDSQQQMFRTKAAMKEFSLQQQAASKHKQDIKKSSSPNKSTSKSVQSSNNKHKTPLEEKKIQEKVPKVKSKQKMQVESDAEEKSDKKDTSRKEYKLKDNDSAMRQQSKDPNKKFPTDLLVVPQRQAAKKASENMRSTNSYVNTVGQKKDSREGRFDEKDSDSFIVKNKEKCKEKDPKEEEKEKEREREKDKEKSKPRGRPPKYPRDESKEKHIAEKEKEKENSHKERDKDKLRIETQQPQKTPAEQQHKSDKPFHKKSEKSDSQLIAYVPQRQAAKKAAEHIKSGMGKTIAAETTILSDEKEKDHIKEKVERVEKEKDNKNKLEGDALPDKCREKDKERLRDIKCDIKDKEIDKSRHLESDGQVISTSKVGSAHMQRGDRRSRGSISTEDVRDKVVTKSIADMSKSTTRIDLTSTSSESTSSSSCSSSSSESDDENDHLFTSKKEIDVNTETKVMTSDSYYTEEAKKCDIKSPQAAEDIKIFDNIVEIPTPNTVDSDVLCIDDSPESIDKKSYIQVDLGIASSVVGSGQETKIETEDEHCSEENGTEKNTKQSPIKKSESFNSKTLALADYSVEKLFNTEKIDSEYNAEIENTQTLEEEMAQRKAELTNFQMGGFKNKINKNSGSLDKFLNKKEMERKEQESLEKATDAMDIDDSLKSDSNSNSKPVTPPSEIEMTSAQHLLSTITKQPGAVVDTIAEIIHIDSESGDCERSKMESLQEDKEDRSNVDAEMKSSPVTHSLSKYLPSDTSKELRMSDEAPHQKQRSPTLYDSSEGDKLVKSQVVDDVPNNNKISREYHIFETKVNEEDSARETMNLVEKLRRQKYMRSSSKPDDGLLSISAISEVRDQDGKSAFNYQSDIFSAALQPAHEFKPTADDCIAATKESVSSIFNKDVVSKMAERMNQIADIDKPPGMFLPPKPIDKNQSTTAKAADSFDALAQSNFFKGDFVEMRLEKDSLDVGANSTKLGVDCEYDENTRMQSPYAHQRNIWDENELIQTRRSVSSSPSSISESNDELTRVNPNGNANELLVCNSNETPLQTQNEEKQRRQRHSLSALSCSAGSLGEKSNFNLVTPFGNISQSQFQLQPHPQHLAKEHQSMHTSLPQPHQQQPQPPLTYMNGADVMPFGYSENNHYNGPVSLFPSQTVASNMPPFPSPSTPIFPSTIGATMPLSQNSQPGSSIFGHLDKHKQTSDSTMPYPLLRQPCAATFTSSSDNLALTQELVSSNVPNVPLTASQMMNSSYSMTTSVESIVNSNIVNPTNSLNHMMNCDIIPANNTSAKDSPSKRSSARFNQIKSPSLHKSPGKSPRNMDLLSRQHGQSNNQKGKYETNQRSKPRSTRGTSSGRARGRGRGRGRPVNVPQIPHNLDFDHSVGSLQNSLAGTVYDLDLDEDVSASIDLKALRDRRRSFDSRVNSGSACEQKFTSPGYQGKLRNAMMSAKSISNMKSPSLGANESDMQTPHSYLSNIHPVLPGPVDMRTYNSGYENQAAANQEAYNNHLLGAFEMGDQTLNEIDEEDEKKLQSDLKASGTYKPKPPVAEIVVLESHASIETTSEEISIDSDNTITKVSLSDSRNQLKLKIKGPLARPENYSVQSACGSLNQNLVSDSLGLQISSAASVTIASSSNTTGTSNLRRMRKKELLRQYQQYQTQDTNMEDGASLPPTDNKATNDSILSGNVGIPKAVDSMSSIPTKEDYKDYTSTDSKKRKRSQILPRELRQLDMPYELERPERRRSVCSSGSNMSVNNAGEPIKIKRRSKTKLDSPNSSEGPKLKIKIGNHVETISDGSRMIGCPPKKRLTSNPVVPSLEILKRDCMNFRKQVMANFNEEEVEKVEKLKVKIKRSSKTSSHKKRKKEKRDYSPVLEGLQSAEAPKLIIRFGGGSAAPANTVVVDPSITARSGVNDVTENSNIVTTEPTASPGIMPIKLKIARNSDGGSYVIGGTKRKNTTGTPATVKHRQDDEISLAALFNTKKQLEVNSGCNYGADPAALHNTASLSESDSVDPITGNFSSYVDESSRASVSATLASNSENTSTVNVQILAPNKANNDLKDGQTKSSKGCPLLPINKDCEVR